MKVFDPDPSLRWHFAMTHPDDEISIAAWIRRCAQAGCHVSISWTHSIPVREQEGRAAAAALGVPSENLYFFHATDGSACDEMAELLPAFHEMMQKERPDRVCCGAFEQGHLDHDATNFLVNTAFTGPVFEIPFYHTYLTRFQTLNRFSDPAGEEILDLSLEEQRLKTAIARQYPSQNIWSVLLWYEISQNARLRPMSLAKTERMRLQTHLNFLRPNHPPRLARKVRHSKAWRRWRASVKATRRAISICDRHGLTTQSV